MVAYLPVSQLFSSYFHVVAYLIFLIMWILLFRYEKFAIHDFSASDWWNSQIFHFQSMKFNIFFRFHLTKFKIFFTFNWQNLSIFSCLIDYIWDQFWSSKFAIFLCLIDKIKKFFASTDKIQDFFTFNRQISRFFFTFDWLHLRLLPVKEISDFSLYQLVKFAIFFQ